MKNKIIVLGAISLLLLASWTFCGCTSSPSATTSTKFKDTLKDTRWIGSPDDNGNTMAFQFDGNNVFHHITLVWSNGTYNQGGYLSGKYQFIDNNLVRITYNDLQANYEPAQLVYNVVLDEKSYEVVLQFNGRSYVKLD